MSGKIIRQKTKGDGSDNENEVYPSHFREKAEKETEIMRKARFRGLKVYEF